LELPILATRLLPEPHKLAKAIAVAFTKPLSNATNKPFARKIAERLPVMRNLKDRVRGLWLGT